MRNRFAGNNRLILDLQPNPSGINEISDFQSQHSLATRVKIGSPLKIIDKKLELSPTKKMGAQSPLKMSSPTKQRTSTMIDSPQIALANISWGKK